MAKKLGIPVILMTGLQNLFHRKLAETLLQNAKNSVLYILSSDEHIMPAHKFVESLERDMRVRCEILEGSVKSMNLGLKGETYKKLTSELTEIHHTAEEHDSTLGRDILNRTNVEGTQESLELAGYCQGLKRFCHWSTVWVCGESTGVVMEDELGSISQTTTLYEKTKWEAEKLVRRWSRRIPITILRPGIPGANSKTGEIDEHSPLLQLLLEIVAPPDKYTALFSEKTRDPIHMAPIDFLAQAGTYLGRTKEGAGQTFHLIDTNPLSFSRFRRLVDRKSHRSHRKGLKNSYLRLIAESPLVTGSTKTFLSYFFHKGSKAVTTPIRPVMFNAIKSTRLLHKRGIFCPTADSYIEAMVRHVESYLDRVTTKPTEEIPDPLA